MTNNADTPYLLIQAGDAPASIIARAGNFDEMFFRSGVDHAKTRRVHVEAGEELPEPDTVTAVVITGSMSMVTDRHGWSEETAAWLRAAHACGVPLFGVCYGHQLMAHAFGGTVDYLAGGPEVGTFPVTMNNAGQNDPLFSRLPSRFLANLSHSQSVLALPPGATALAFSDRDPHQAIRYGPRAVSVQFHPEFSAEATAACLDFYAAERPNDAAAFRALAEKVEDTPEATSLLRWFLEG
ncbi:MAG: glutamine amidotransferase [Planctomycetaceae bacterium]|nr:glutamine amidotransferase [Planctomycetaceae bacterium]